ncbi:hypothetical protein CVD28_01460 [Bacillus sp. M6-12]|uniref:hypothetical protein n=1 Tax=Bacillus sp. M6-12 TaxID=2054166 RepID=UPI000C761B06|nr:hypothetical protein [Bacillus sp. M6-12]PLS19102.1 hypothetical protein CVD28_01460 [Bacillus sp. M6-12]
MSLQIAKIIEPVKIQIEYTLCHYVAPSVAEKNCEYVTAHSLKELLDAVSNTKLEELKEDFDADEVFVSSMVVISKDEDNQVITHFDPENQVTTMKVEVGEQDMASNLAHSLAMIEKQTDEFHQNIKRTIGLYKKGE